MHDPDDARRATRYGTIVVGAGQAGPTVADRLASPDHRVALVEADRFGGTCLNSGCRPTKALRASARAAHVARSSAGLGVQVADVRVDVAAAVDRKDALIDGWRDGAMRYYGEHPHLDWVHGRARFVGSENGEHVMAVGDHLLRAPRVVLDTGARSVPPPIPGLDGVDWLDHHGVLDLRAAPEHLVVLGGSYIGLELGQVFRRFGSAVTIVEQSERVVSREDPDVSDAIRTFLAAEGIDVRCGVGVREVGPGASSPVAVTLADGTAITGSHLLVAAGRVPNADDLGLDTVGVRRDAHGYVETDEHFRTSVAGIYAVGDVNGRGAFTHTAYQDGEILADHLTGGSRSVAGRVTTYALFTDPPLGRVGVTRTQAEAQGLDAEVVDFPMARVTRAVLDAETDGLVRLVVDRTTRHLLGAAWLGANGDELVQALSLLMHVGAPIDVVRDWLPIHPTIAEFLPTIVGGSGH